MHAPIGKWVAKPNPSSPTSRSLNWPGEGRGAHTPHWGCGGFCAIRVKLAVQDAVPPVIGIADRFSLAGRQRAMMASATLNRAGREAVLFGFDNRAIGVILQRGICAWVTTKQMAYPMKVTAAFAYSTFTSI
eukprot:scaffold110183_cov37-Prasinocladus_malaysianus.AAC.1